MSLALTGTGVTSGIAMGKVRRIAPGELTLPEYPIEAAAINDEIARLRQAVQRSDDFLARILERIDDTGGETARELIEVHRLMLHDPMLVEIACESIRTERINAEWALAQQGEILQEKFQRIDDDYLMLRGEDLEQVVNLVQRELASRTSSLLEIPEPRHLEDTILVAPELTPADMTILSQRRVSGLITEHGGLWSHTAILARSLEIPMLVGVHHAAELLMDGEAVVLDGHYGAVLVNPDEGLKRHYGEKLANSRRHHIEMEKYLSRPSKTADDKTFHMFGNAELPMEFRRCMAAGVEGIGLMRTEYLFLDDHIPDEQEQYRAYRRAIRTMGGKPVTIRTVDAGSDKLPDAIAMKLGTNPALGLRGLRLSLSITDLFKAQLRAILRASVDGPVRILLPMLTTVDEIGRARQLIAECRQSLRAEGIAIDPELPVGGMIETPSAALNVDAMATELDFMSIGTNDLIQYVLAIDRQDEMVAYLYDPANPAVLELIARIVESGRRHDTEVSVCSELAGDPHTARLLMGLGITHFSMPPAHVPAVKKSLTEASADRCREIVERFRQAGRQDGHQLIKELQKEGGVQ